MLQISFQTSRIRNCLSLLCRLVAVWAVICGGARVSLADEPLFVLSQVPVGYWQFDNTGDGRVPNRGVLGPQADGVYQGTAAPSASGPVFAGFPATNTAVLLDGITASVRIPALDLHTNTVTITAWIRADGSQAGAAGLVFTRGAGLPAGLMMDRAGGLDLGYNWNDTSASLNWISYLSLPDTNWAFVALALSSGQAALYVGDPSSGTFQAATNFATHAPQSFANPTYIGSDGTNNHFRGAVDEVAIFSRTLAAGEIYSQYAAAVGNLPARIFVHPSAPCEVLFEGDTLRLRVDAGGTPPIQYQWRKSGVEISGATNSLFVKPSMVAEDNGTYDVIVTAGTGAALVSQPAIVSVTPLESPTITRSPVGRTLYPGGTLSLAIAASGGGLSYAWSKDGLAIPGATNSSYEVVGVDSADAGSYEVRVMNNVGQTNAEPALVVVVQPPANSFEGAVVEDGPEAWWRLNETNGATVMLDALGRHDGFYTNATGDPLNVGAPGLAESTATEFSGSPSYGMVPYSPELNPVEFTLVAWVRTAALAEGEITPVSSRYEGKGVWFWLYPAGDWSGGASGSGFNYYIPSSAPGAKAGSNEWAMLAISYSPETSLRFLVNGEWDGTGYTDFERNDGGPLLIGARGASASTVADGFFKGVVDDVALYRKVLTPEQLQKQYRLGLYGTNSAPVFKHSPAATNLLVGASIALSARVEGSEPLTVQWFKDGTPVPNGNSRELVLADLHYTDAGNYTLLASNLVGSAVSSPALVTVAPPIPFANATNDLVLHLDFEGNYLDSSGKANHGNPIGSPGLVQGRIGELALNYSTQPGSGTYNYVSLGRPSELLVASNKNFSVSYWIKLSANALDGDVPVLANSQNSLGGHGLTIGPSFHSGSWAWSLSDGLTGADSQGPPGAINDGQWHHLLHVFNRTEQTATTYLDGVSANVTSLDGVGDTDTGGGFNVGQTSGGDYAQDSDVGLDDLGFWRRALAPEEVRAIYSAGANYRNTFDTYGPVELQILRSGARVLLVWPSGVLLQSDSPNGPWTPVPGASAPNHWVSPEVGTRFFRIQL